MGIYTKLKTSNQPTTIETHTINLGSALLRTNSDN
jgi:hypothetical protein